MNIFFRLTEEILPAVTFFFNKKKVLKKIENESEYAEIASQYENLEPDELTDRISEEHERATSIDDKTSKFTLGLSVSLTVLATASVSLVKLLPDNQYTNIISIICGMSSLYMLSAGIVALGALKTLPKYGYGTLHKIELKNNGAPYLSKALVCQEKVNILRQLRNESAYQSLRNGFILLFAALTFSIVILANSGTKINSSNMNKKKQISATAEKKSKKEITNNKTQSAKKLEQSRNKALDN